MFLAFIEKYKVSYKNIKTIAFPFRGVLLHCIPYSNCNENKASSENIQNPGSQGALNEQKPCM